MSLFTCWVTSSYWKIATGCHITGPIALRHRVSPILLKQIRSESAGKSRSSYSSPAQEFQMTYNLDYSISLCYVNNFLKSFSEFVITFIYISSESAFIIYTGRLTKSLFYLRDTCFLVEFLSLFNVSPWLLIYISIFQTIF